MKKMLNLLVVSHMYPSRDMPNHGIFMVRQAGYLREYDVESFFLVPRPKAIWPMYALSRWRSYRPENTLLDHGHEIKQTRYFRPPSMKFRLWEDYFMYVSLRKSARIWHKKKPFDAVMGVSILPDAGVASMLGRDMHIPSVGLAVGSDVKVYPESSARLKKKLSTVISALDMIVGVSGDICNSIKAACAPKRAPATVYLGRDTALFCPPENKSDYRAQYSIPGDAVAGIYVGNLSVNKGMGELAAVIPALFSKYPQLYLMLVGRGPHRDAFETLNQQYGRIILTGNLPPEQVANCLKCSDFMIFPSYSEGMPQAVLEAMNCGLCVIASRVGGIPEAVIDGQTGLLINPKNPEQLRHAIESLLSSEPLRQKLSMEARAHCEQVFDPHKNAERFAKLLFSLCSGEQLNNLRD